MNTGFFYRLQRGVVWPVLLLVWLACRFEARANPTGGSVSPSQATITGQGTPTVNINQITGSAWINWSTFNVGVGETVNFNQPSANSVTWNQINDANPSQILGDVNANGYIVLQNANGFYIGGQAVLTTHGLVMTTAATMATPLTLANGGPWSFDTPPPAARIQNYGKINITGGSTAYLIAADIVNGGSITAPNGQIGLYDGETVLVSTSPSGQGISAQVTLPQGSVDNEGKLTANGGSVVAQAQFVNQNGVIQADTAANVNGTIELLGSSSVTLGANSTISTAGDSTASSVSSGGSVQIQGGNSFSDASGSSINVSGASQGGNAGSVSISAPQMMALNSMINGQAAVGYLNGALTIDTGDIALNSDGSPVSGALGLDVAALSSGLSQINLLASDNITLAAGAQWVVAPNGGIPTALSMVAGNEIELQNGSGIQANGQNISLQAATVDLAGMLQADTVGSAAGVIRINASQNLILEAGSGSKIQANCGTINLIAPTVDLFGTLEANSLGSGGGGVQINAGQNLILESGSTIDATGLGGIPANVSLQAGTEIALNSGSEVQANGGNIALNASTVDLAGTLQADSLGSLGGVIAISAGQNLTLEAGSAINATGIGGIPTQVSLESGSEMTLNSGATIQANGGNINLNAPYVDQGGTLQANSLGSANGVIEIDASRGLTLEGSSVISAIGDSTVTTPSSGGFVVLNAGNSYSDTPGSTISVSGNAAGGQGGLVEIFDPQANSTPIQSSVLGAFAWLINPFDMTLSGNPTDISSSNPNFNISDLAAYSRIDLHSLDDIILGSDLNFGDASVPATLSLVAGSAIVLNNSIDVGNNWSVVLGGGGIQTQNGINVKAGENIVLNTIWQLLDQTTFATLGLTAGNDITLDTASAINAGQDWNISLMAGTGFKPTAGQLTPASGSDGIYLDGGPAESPIVSAYILAENGSINLWAANEVQVGWTGSSAGADTVNAGAGGITTDQNGNIGVFTEYGDVNTGSSPNGYDYRKTAPYAVPDASLGGISTSGGGSVAIDAKSGNVISYMPSSSTTTEGGTGAFSSSQAGSVSITAGGGVYGHYVEGDGDGLIMAGQDVGLADTADFALSLITGGWTVQAPNGNIYLQEVRNPNGDFNPTISFGGPSAGKYRFTYSSQAYVDLSANGVFLTDLNVPRTSDAIPVLYPPILNITAGSGGVTLEGDVTLFPSQYQNLNITTTDGGNFISTAGLSDPYTLMMSDSAQIQWQSSATFGDLDHGTLANEPLETSPVTITVAGNMENLNLITTKVTYLTVDGNMINCGFSGQNLLGGDDTYIHVTGQIFNTSPYAFVNLTEAIPNIPAGDLLPGMPSSWDNIFTLAVNPTLLASYQLPANTPISEWVSDILSSAGVFTEQTVNGQLVGLNPGFVYNASTERLGYTGPMTPTVLSELTQPLYVLHLVGGQPVMNPSTGQFEVDAISWAPASGVQTLFTQSQGNPALNSVQLGYRIGGPGEFDVTAGSISLGNSDGILSSGIFDPQGGFNRYENLATITPVGANLVVTVNGPDEPTDPSQPVSTDNPLVSSLDMLTSTIASLDGGSIVVKDNGGSMDLGSPELFNSTGSKGGAAGNHLSFGIYTTAGGAVTVESLGDVDIDGSRIATYDGGKITVKSDTGDVNIGSGSSDLNVVDVVYGAEAAGNPYVEDVFGSGIVANTLVPPQNGEAFPPNSAKFPGDIEVDTPEGDIIATSAGIIQEALDGSIAPGPTVTLNAGTFPTGTPGQQGYSAGHVGNIDLGNSGVIGGTVNLSANGNIIGQIISRQNSTVNAAQSFSGTLLAGGSANVSGGGTVSGTIVGVGGANVSGTGGVTASVLGQNVSVNGGAATSTLGSSAAATASTQSAAQQASSQAQQQVTADQGDQGNDKKKKETQIRKVGHVSVLLSAADRK